MKKIPSLFLRDWKNNPSLVTRERNPECEWVFDGEGTPTRKWDGTCCMVRDGKLYKRYDAKFDKKKEMWKSKPEGFEPCQEPDENTGHQPGWIPVRYETKQEKKENLYFKMAWDLIDKASDYSKGILYLNFPNPRYVDGTYELVGITINGNLERLNGLYFIKHGYNTISSIAGYKYDHSMRLNVENSLKYDAIKKYLEYNRIEGIVWHHPDGRMSKIKRIDFGLEWS